jgi:hypothetical protein
VLDFQEQFLRDEWTPWSRCAVAQNRNAILNDGVTNASPDPRAQALSGSHSGKVLLNFGQVPRSALFDKAKGVFIDLISVKFAHTRLD